MNVIKPETQITLIDGIAYDVLQKADLEQCIECVKNTFAYLDPLSIAAGLTPDELGVFINIFLRDNLVSDALSVVARDEKTHDILGGILINDFMAEIPETMDGLPASFDHILALLDSLDQMYHENNIISKGEILHVLMAGVSPKNSNLGIGFHMLEKGYEIARSRNYKGAIAEVTGPASQYLAEKFGARTLYKIRYAEFENKGQYPFKSITDCETIDLMYIDL